MKSSHEHGIEAHEHRSHKGYHRAHKHHEKMIEDYKRRFFVSVILTIPILIISPMIQNVFGIKLKFYGDIYLLFLLSTAVFLYGGYPFLKGFFDEVKKRALGMMTLIAVAITVA